MKNRKIEQKKTKQLVIDSGLHSLLKIKATRAGMSIKDYVEGILADDLGVEKE